MSRDELNRSPLMERFVAFWLRNRACAGLLVLLTIAAGIIVAPIDWQIPGVARYPISVDALPDVGENQQIVFARWSGRSPQDVEDQVTYPLTVSLLGIPNVKTIRSFSMFGISMVYVIFEDFYWGRSRIVEKLGSLPDDLLPRDLKPIIGPDATALGQVFWYTLEGRSPDGRPTGGWDLHELRTLQDWTVRYALTSVGGVSEVASVGGFVQEYQIDVDPDRLQAYSDTLEDVFNAVRTSNIDVGARTIELNRAEYVIRSVGFVKDLADFENAVVKISDTVPICVKHVAHVSLGPAERRGVLDKEGAEVVGGVVVARYDANPLEVTRNVRARIDEIQAGLPRKTLPDGTISQVQIVPF